MRTLRNLPRSFGWLVFGGMTVVCWLAPSAQVAAQEKTPTSVTFAKDVAPLLQRSCQNCHHQKGPAPMSLVTYDEVRPWARAIKLRTSKREMPPWFIDKHVGIQQFKDDPSLSDEEIARIGVWVDAGAPQGNPADLPPPRRFAAANEWTIGTPDLIISSDPFIVKSEEPDFHGMFGPTPTGLTEDRYIKAVEVKEVKLKDPERYRPSVVHHSALHAALPEVALTAPLSTEGFGNGRFRLTWELGQNATVYPDFAGVLLEAGSVLVYSNHLHSNGQEEPIRLDVAFKFHPKGYKPKYLQSGFLLIGHLGDELDIPAGQDNIRFDGYQRITKPTMLTTFEPHMHLSGKRMCLEALYPDGRREMLNCAGYNHYWVRVYTYEEDVAPLLPTGTMLHVIGWYDNSTSNPRNTDPRNWKGEGNRTVDDMFHMLPKMVFLTEDQFKEEVAARKAKQQKAVTATATGQE